MYPIRDIELRDRQLPHVLVNVSFVLPIRHQWPCKLCRNRSVQNAAKEVSFGLGCYSTPIQAVSYQRGGALKFCGTDEFDETFDEDVAA